MTAYNGTLQPSPFIEDTLRCSATIIDQLVTDRISGELVTDRISGEFVRDRNHLPGPVEIGELTDITPLGAGTRGNNVPVSMRQRGWVGREVMSFLDDYYYRFHLVPNSFVFTAIVAEINEDVVLWNAFFVSKTCSQIVEVLGDEFDLTGLTPPETLNALAYVTLTLTIPIEGESDFDASATFDFSDPDNPVLSISGTRPNLSMFQWTWPVTEQLRFNTEIIPSHNRTEQRIARRQGVPARYVATQLVARGEYDCARLEAMLQKWVKRTWTVPLWFEAEKHTGSLPAISSSIAVDTRYADFRADSYAFIWGDRDNYESIMIDTVADDLLTLSEPTVNSYIGGKWIMPCRIGRMIDAGRLRRFAGGALCDIAWRIEDVQAVTGFAAVMSYDGYTVLTDPAVLQGDSGDFSHDPDIAVLDAGTGPFEIISNSDFNEVEQSHGWRLGTKAGAWWLRQLLHDIKGRQKAVLVPTFKRDLEITRPIGASETSLYVRNIGATANMGLNILRTYVAFRPAGASIIPRKVAGISVVSAAEELITLNAVPGAAFSPGEYLCWVDRVRLASDEIEFHWYGRGRAAVETPLVRVTS